MTYPEEFIRGILNDEYVNDENSVETHLFYFHHLSSGRGDSWCEESINWNDEGAIEFSLNQTRNDGQIKFKSGIAIVPKDEIDHITSRPNNAGCLSYERYPLEENPYHGNLLLKVGTPKHIMHQIAANIALSVSKIIPNHNIES